jgi:regulator of RNase E activity RraA
MGDASMNNIGFRIFPLTNRPTKELLEQFRTVVTPHISDNGNRMNAVSHALRPYHQGGKLVGAALTVRTRPGDNLMVHKAIDLAEPGDVIVVDAGGDLTNSIAGEIMKCIAQQKQIAGFVIDGAIRDVSAFAGDTFPVFARGVTHRGPYKDGPGEINVPVSIGGMVVYPGDIIVGDEDGLAVVSPDEAANLLRLIKEIQDREAEMLKSIRNGTLNRDWVDERLRQLGCDFG